MTGAVSFALAADEPASRRLAGVLFPEAEHRFLTRDELRPPAPFAGQLFELLAAFAERSAASTSHPPMPGAATSGTASSGAPRESAGSCPVVGLVVPVTLTRGAAAPAATPGAPPPGALLAVADHVNLELRGPLTGRWPAGAPRAFPPLTGIYQPAVVRARGGPRVYSSGVVVAGVADARRLTPFEVKAVREGGIIAVSDSLVPPAIVAAYYGLTLAACGLPQADDNDEE